METATIRGVAKARPLKVRSAVTNGRRLHVIPPGDTRWSRRFADVLNEVISDLGGADRLSEGQRQLARRCATISVVCEKLEGVVAGGGEVDLILYGVLTDRLGRAFDRLGLKRVPKNITPTLSEYLKSKTIEAAE
jgi:hypothetical protein